MVRRIVIDTDPGHDDALALFLAFAAADRLDLVGITAVAGNVEVDQTFLNARRICRLAEAEHVPVFRGADGPIMRPLRTAKFICGEDGLAGMTLPQPVAPAQTRHAVNFLVEALSGPEKTTVCALGPLTNLALALRLAPGIADNIDRLVIMGGARDMGNITASAEFNFFVDPHAAAIVFGAGLPITLFPLNATYQAVATPQRTALFDNGGPVATQVAAMLRRHRPGGASLGGEDGHPMHDLCTVAWLLWPELFEGRDCHVAIETGDGPCMGRSTIDWWGRSGEAPNAHAIGALNADDLFARVADCIHALDKSIAAGRKKAS